MVFCGLRKSRSSGRDIIITEDLKNLEVEKILAGKKRIDPAISLRVPAQILRALKAKARIDGKKYQSLMIDYCRRGLREK